MTAPDGRPQTASTGEDRQWGIFAKAWKPGLVKTRLAQAVGLAAAAAIAKALVECVAARLAGTPGRGVLCVAPAEHMGLFEPLASKHDLRLSLQSPGDLGQRMHDYLAEGFSNGARKVLLVGSDCPWVSSSVLEAAYAALDTHSVVLGPSEDGGYWLIGAKDRVPPVFEGVAWSSTRVWEQTLEGLAAAGLSSGRLPTRYDVDTVEDLARLRRDLTEAWAQADPSLARLAAELTRILDTEHRLD